jgi:hypothetical protein
LNGFFAITLKSQNLHVYRVGASSGRRQRASFADFTKHLVFSKPPAYILVHAIKLCASDSPIVVGLSYRMRGGLAFVVLAIFFPTNGELPLLLGEVLEEKPYEILLCVTEVTQLSHFQVRVILSAFRFQLHHSLLTRTFLLVLLHFSVSRSWF